MILPRQIVFHYLDQPELHVSAEAVSNNHFDQDGLMSVYALVDPLGRSQTRAGDGRRARRRLRDVPGSRLLPHRLGDRGTRPRPRRRRRRVRTTARSCARAARPSERFRDHWAEEDEHLQASEAAIASGEIPIEELEAIDLAIVTVPERWAWRPVHRLHLFRARRRCTRSR